MTICRHQNVRLAITMLVTIFVDYIAIILGLLSAYHLRISLSLIEVSPHFKLEGIYTFIIVPIVFLVTLYLNGSYQIDKPYWDKVKTVFRSVTIGVIAAIVLMYTGHVTNDVSRLFVGFSYIFIMLFITVFRFISHKILNALQILYIPVLLVGAGKTAELVNKSLQRMPVSYYKIIGFVDDNPKSESIATTLPCLGRFIDVEQVIQKTGVQNVLVCAPGLESKQ
jgi:FlaA1/EpsC-like NDP-sugar epimerase